MNKNIKCIINAESLDCYLGRGNYSFILTARHEIITKLHGYLKRFRTIFLKHCTTETEINIKENNIDDIGWGRLKVLENDSKILNFDENIGTIINGWLLALNGQPQCAQNTGLAKEIRKMIKNSIIGFVEELQEDVLTKKKVDENLECERKCTDGPIIFNFTSHVIDQDIIKQFEGLDKSHILRTGKNILLGELKMRLSRLLLAIFIE